MENVELKRGHEIVYGQPPQVGVVLDAVPDYDPSRVYVAPVTEFPSGRGSVTNPGALGEPELVGPGTITPVEGSVPWSVERIVAGLRRGWAANNEALLTALTQALKNKHVREMRRP